MMNSLWIAKTGMNAQQTNMDTVSHNLSNVTTTGFKRQTAVFEDLIYQNLRQVGSQVDEQNQPAHRHAHGPGRAPGGHHAHLLAGHAAGDRARPTTWPSMATGFFQIQMPDGTTTYTRDGTFALNGDGTPGHLGRLPAAGRHHRAARFAQLHHQQDRHRHRAGPGRDPAAANRPAESGQLHQSGRAWSRWERTCTVKARPRARRRRGAPGETSMGSVLQCYLESSNVNVVHELVTMIQTQRAYEMNSKAISTSDQMLGRLVQI